MVCKPGGGRLFFDDDGSDGGLDQARINRPANHAHLGATDFFVP